MPRVPTRIEQVGKGKRPIEAFHQTDPERTPAGIDPFQNLAARFWKFLESSGVRSVKVG